MKTIPASIVIAALSFSLAGVAQAASGTSRLTISVASIDALEVTDGGTIRLSGSDTLTGQPDRSARLNYSHNSNTAKAIVAQVSGAQAGQDLTLTVAVDGGAGTKTLLANGAPVSAQVVYNDILAGALTNRTITYEATATKAGTPNGNYRLAITYTTINVGA